VLLALSHSNLEGRVDIRGPSTLPEFKLVVFTKAQVNPTIILSFKSYTNIPIVIL